MDMTFPSFLIGSLSNLQVTRTSITSRTSSNSRQIGIFTLELLALECEKVLICTCVRHCVFILIRSVVNLQINIPDKKKKYDLQNYDQLKLSIKYTFLSEIA